MTDVCGDNESAISFEEMNTVANSESHITVNENESNLSETVDDQQKDQEMDDDETQFFESEDPNPNTKSNEPVENVEMESDTHQDENEREENHLAESNGAVHNEEEDEEQEEEEDVEQEQDNDTAHLNEEGENDIENEAPEKLSQFPISKIRKIMKIGLGEDSVIKVISKESAFLVGQAAELFVAALSQQAAKITQSSKKKTMTIQHLTAAIADAEEFAFLEGTMVPDYNF